MKICFAVFEFFLHTDRWNDKCQKILITDVNMPTNLYGSHPVIPQLSTVTHCSTTALNYIVDHNFQQTSKTENAKKIPYRTEHNMQTAEEL
jgi:hypothetical protein